MKKLIEITGLESIKSQYRQGFDELKDLHYKMQDIWFMFGYVPFNRKMALTVAKKLEVLTEEMRNKQVRFEAKQRQTDIVNIVSGAIYDLKEYAENFDATDEEKGTQMAINYRVVVYAKNKENLTEEKIIQQLKINKTIYLCYIKGSKLNLKTESFFKVQDELLDLFSSKYKLLS